MGARAWEHHSTEPSPWTVEKSKTQVEKLGQTWTVTHAQREYGASTFGWINELEDSSVGEIWPHCPRWFQEFAPGEVRAYANLVVEGIRAKNNDLFEQWQGDSIFPLDLINDILKFSHAVSFIENKQQKQRSKEV